MNQKGRNNPNFKNGRCCTPHYCIDCGKEIDKMGRSIRCSKCLFKIRRGKNHPMFGKHHTKKSKKIIGKKSKQKFTKQYLNKIKQKHRGNKKRDINGYILIKDYKHINANLHNDILEHILLMSKNLKRPIKKGEIVHHINFIRNDNRLSNLYLFPNTSEHLKASGSIFKLIDTLLKQKIIKFKKGRYMIIQKRQRPVGGKI